MASNRIKFHKSVDDWKHSVHVTQSVWHYGKLDNPKADIEILIQHKDMYLELNKDEALELAQTLTRAVDTLDPAVELSKKKFVEELKVLQDKKGAVK